MRDGAAVKVGTVKALWRFPVKSMQGEQLDELHITSRGVVGDRAWALRDLENRRIASAKKFVGLLKFHAHYEGTPEAGNLPPVKITLPDGREIHADDGNASELSRRRSATVFIWSIALVLRENARASTRRPSSPTIRSAKSSRD